MSNTARLDERQVRENVARLLRAAVSSSGRTRCAIASEAQVHRDALRRVLAAKRSVSLGETMRILAASGIKPNSAIMTFLIADSENALRWLDTDLSAFLEDFMTELPLALERVLGNQLNEIRPRWAKGTAHRVARLLSDHIEELERRDALYVASA